MLWVAVFIRFGLIFAKILRLWWREFFCHGRGCGAKGGAREFASRRGWVSADYAARKVSVVLPVTSG